MLNFETIKTEHIELYKKYYKESLENSCENAFANLIIWREAYNNMIDEQEGILFIKSGNKPNERFRLPVGGDLKRGIEILKEYTNGEPLHFWAQEGPKLDEFLEIFGEEYNVAPNRDAFDYIYRAEDLAELSGKKYHSKRNHINAFSKTHQWRYAEITGKDISAVLETAQRWYNEKEQPLEKSLTFEKKGIEILLNEKDKLQISGGAVYVEDKMVAFTLGSAINDKVFDIHIEKALKDYPEAYTVINREFAKTVAQNYEYINREDDMGLEGLRRAKLSYRPNKLLEKYSLVEKK